MHDLILTPELEEILASTPALDRAYLVGGSVRDALLGIPVKDHDIEVYGVDYDTLERVLSAWGRTDRVGRSFGVVKLTTVQGVTYDFTIPRRDSKVAPGHRGFKIECDPDIAIDEAVRRRDFTINALLYDPRLREVLDPTGGRADLRRRVLRHVSDAFPEDPLRVLRGMQFAGRFNLHVAPETAALCHDIRGSYHELAWERVWEEWRKWAARSAVPSAGLRFLRQTGWLVHFPEIDALRETPQDPQWHPEGDVFEHTCHCCDALVGLARWRAAADEDRAVYMLAVLTHDVGKPATTSRHLRRGRERIVSPAHDQVGARIAARFLERIHAPPALRARVVPLVREHLAYRNPVTDRAVRRLASRLRPESIENLCLVMEADHLGRPPHPAVAPESVQAIRKAANRLSVAAASPRPLLMGRDLIDIGMQPGPAMGTILDAAYEAQLDGEFTNPQGARAWLAKRFGRDIGSAS